MEQNDSEWSCLFNGIRGVSNGVIMFSSRVSGRVTEMFNEQVLE